MDFSEGLSECFFELLRFFLESWDHIQRNKSRQMHLEESDKVAVPGGESLKAHSRRAGDKMKK